jgi:hypothetical protein
MDRRAAYEDQALRDQAICTQLLSHDIDVVLPKIFYQHQFAALLVVLGIQDVLLVG